MLPEKVGENGWPLFILQRCEKYFFTSTWYRPSLKKSCTNSIQSNRSISPVKVFGTYYIYMLGGNERGHKRSRTSAWLLHSQETTGSSFMFRS